jgi:hypothetical protein
MWNNYLSQDAQNNRQLHQTINKDCIVANRYSDIEGNTSFKDPNELFDNTYSKLKSIKIIFDTGATQHIFPTKEIFYKYRKIPETANRFVTFGDGSKQRIRGVGDTCLLKNVLYVPEVKLGIISIPQLDQMEYKCIFLNGKLSSII